MLVGGPENRPSAQSSRLIDPLQTAQPHASLLATLVQSAELFLKAAAVFKSMQPARDGRRQHDVAYVNERRRRVAARRKR